MNARPDCFNYQLLYQCVVFVVISIYFHFCLSIYTFYSSIYLYLSYLEASCVCERDILKRPIHTHMRPTLIPKARLLHMFV